MRFHCVNGLLVLHLWGNTGIEKVKLQTLHFIKMLQQHGVSYCKTTNTHRMDLIETCLRMRANVCDAKWPGREMKHCHRYLQGLTPCLSSPFCTLANSCWPICNVWFFAFKISFDSLYSRCGEPAARVNILYGEHQNFRYQVRLWNCVKMKLHDKQVLGQ